MALLRPLLVVAVISALAVFGSQWRSGGLAGAAPVATERPWFTPTPVEAGDEGTAALDTQARVTRALASARGFAVPEGFELPVEPELLPGSPREYRGGFHEGIDFPLSLDMPVVAAKAGTIVRIDRDYVEWSVDEQIAAEDEAFHLGYTPDRTLDRLRGRQVWIDHGHGVVSRYAHLAAVEPLAVGAFVEQGALIGRVGNSGTKAGPHLHIELRVGGAYLGEGLSGDALLRVLRRAFSQ